MLNALLSCKGGTFPHDPALRGYHAIYRDNEVNHCPGCGRSQWLVGRVSAECAFCATALPLVETYRGAATHTSNRRPVWSHAGASC